MKPIAFSENFLRKRGVKHPKAYVYGAIAVLTVIAAWIIYRMVKKQIDKYRSAHPNPERIQTGMTSELGSLVIKNTTITDSEAMLIAQNLLNAMNRYGTDEQAILDNLGRAKSADDLYLIIQKFGVKPYDGFGLATGWFETTVIATMKNLQGWLRAELSGGDLKAVKAIFDSHGVSL